MESNITDTPTKDDTSRFTAQTNTNIPLRRKVERLTNLPPYIFSEINKIRDQAQRQGKKLVNLAIGDPDLPTPNEILNVICEASNKPQNHVYGPYEGSLSFRNQVALWMKERFGVDVNPEQEVIALIGSKEGIAHLPLALCNPNDVALFPSPGYPIFESSLILAGATPVALPHRAENKFLPDFGELKRLLEKHRPKLLFLNYPSNPTSRCISRELLKDIVSLCHHHGTAIAYDNAYSEIYYGNAKPPSILEIDGAKDIAIEFHSFSKTFNMTGWRLGWAVGNEKLVKALLRVKTHIDSGPLLTVQQAGEFALQHASELASPMRKVYEQRKIRMLAELSSAKLEFLSPEATFYVWVRVPGQQSSMDFCKHLIEKRGVVVTPGIGFGIFGEGFFRVSLTGLSSHIASQTASHTDSPLFY